MASFSWRVLVIHDLFLVALGLSMEVVFSAILDLPKAKDWSLTGYSYVWMIPIYALVYPALCWAYPRFQASPFVLRGLFYVVSIYLVEYASGWLLRQALGKCPWEDGYFASRWAVHGLIRLDFAPAWFAASWIFETAFRALRGLL